MATEIWRKGKKLLIPTLRGKEKKVEIAETQNNQVRADYENNNKYVVKMMEFSIFKPTAGMEHTEDEVINCAGFKCNEKVKF